MNEQNITKLINHLKKVNRINFNMREWFDIDRSTYAYNLPSVLLDQMEKGHGDCGTVACIAGHAALLDAAENESPNSKAYNTRIGAMNKARVWLGLTSEQANELFLPGHSSNMPIPDQIPLDYAIVVLENLKKTGEVDWGDLTEFYSPAMREDWGLD